MGNLVKQAVDGKNLDRTAFSMVRRLHKMSTQKLHATLPALLLYIDLAGLEKKLSDEPQLAIGEQTDGDDDDPADDAGEGEVVETRSLTNPKSMPTSEQVKSAADRAERRSKTPKAAEVADDDRDLRPRHLREPDSISEAKH